MCVAVSWIVWCSLAHRHGPYLVAIMVLGIPLYSLGWAVQENGDMPAATVYHCALYLLANMGVTLLIVG